MIALLLTPVLLSPVKLPGTLDPLDLLPLLELEYELGRTEMLGPGPLPDAPCSPAGSRLYDDYPPVDCIHGGHVFTESMTRRWSWLKRLRDLLPEPSSPRAACTSRATVSHPGTETSCKQKCLRILGLQT